MFRSMNGNAMFNCAPASHHEGTLHLVHKACENLSHVEIHQNPDVIRVVVQLVISGDISRLQTDLMNADFSVSCG